MKHCNKWLRWAFVEAAWVSMGCDSYFGGIYKKKSALGKKANTAILCVARRMARIAWQLLTQKRRYENLRPLPESESRPAVEVAPPAGSAKEDVLGTSAVKVKGHKDQAIFPTAPIAH